MRLVRFIALVGPLKGDPNRWYPNHHHDVESRDPPFRRLLLQSSSSVCVLLQPAGIQLQIPPSETLRASWFVILSMYGVVLKWRLVALYLELDPDIICPCVPGSPAK